MNPVSISVEEASFLLTEHLGLFRNNSLHESRGFHLRMLI